MELNEMLQITGLDWKVSKEELQTVGGILIPNKIAIMRNDNNAILGVHGDGYEPYQNDELLELLHKISSHTGMELHGGGSFGGGEKVWFQLKSDNLNLGNDTIEGYISGFNSFDGKANLAFGNTNITVSCLNTFHRGYKEVDTKIRHSQSMKPRIEEILINIDRLVAEEKVSFSEIKMLQSKPMSIADLDFISRTILQIDKNQDIKTISTRKQNMLSDLNHAMRIETDQKGMNLWGGFSGMTRYTTHDIAKKAESRAVNKMFGKVGDIERRVWNHLIAV
jgi:phage/plasmid-like protein (TIGR03299 family)